MASGGTGELHLALEVGYFVGEKAVSTDLVESVLSRQLDDLEPNLMRHGHRIEDLVERLTPDLRRSRCCSAIHLFRSLANCYL